ncbi:hypothetical protein EJ06DRAFT_555251 [Trichodelitschia bisporula]|uniref:Ribosomal RNA methyltransferase FtsJ domain-containing protein n=1 Tax=Trichodelitschia bisporula TaxID=703511 RepID=A0A6G1I2Y7_9PEZI|nr:hypothetical protein EJ06DRAFT_555251 [Trichodelitschia bisporula]
MEPNHTNISPTSLEKRLGNEKFQPGDGWVDNLTKALQATTLTDTPVVPEDSSYDMISLDTPDDALQLFLHKASEFEQLMAWMAKGSNCPTGDKHYAEKRAKVDKAGFTTQRSIFLTMQNIAEELNQATGAFELSNRRPDVLDLCMAPGGYLAYALKKYLLMLANAVTLGREKGGYAIHVPYDRRDSRVQVSFRDVTLLGYELGMANVPEAIEAARVHPDNDELLCPWPFAAPTNYHLVLCDGQVLRTHGRAEYRESCESTRLMCSQMAIALQRVHIGGTIIALMHRAYQWNVFALLAGFAKFSDLQLFKPTCAHRESSSFYLVAKNLRPDSAEAKGMVEKLRRAWMACTFPELGMSTAVFDSSKDAVNQAVAEFGDTLLEMAKPIWEIQTEALRAATWMQAEQVADEAQDKAQGQGDHDLLGEIE